MPTKTPDQIRKQITEMMVEAIKKGTPPWRKPWSNMSNTGLPCNFQSGRKYTGINPLVLMWVSMLYGYNSKNWGTSASWFKQVGAHVVKGEVAAHITFFRMIPRVDLITKKPLKNSKGEDILFPILREFAVFNADQLQAPSVADLLDGRCKIGGGSIVKSLLGVDDRRARTAITTKVELVKIAERYLSTKEIPKLSWSRDKMADAIHQGIDRKLKAYLSSEIEQNADPDFEPAEKFIEATGCKLQFGGKRAYCDVVKDIIKVPGKRTFETMSDFYETVFHELIHWTERPKRVGIKEQDEAKHQYPFNELVAEIGACLLLCELNVPLAEQMIVKSTSYVSSWLERMDANTKYIFDAATQASKAVDYLLAFIGKQNPAWHSPEESTKTHTVTA